jgi:hypothetical protein
MYKVFINERPIILTDSICQESGFTHLDYDDITISEIISKLTKESIGGMVLFCKNLKESWDDFKSNFKVIQAAGGLVLNEENEFLFIFRGCKWDLPKGRVEKGEKIKEAAVREVQEECGISNIIVHEFLITTHHIFYYNEKIKLKETQWFQMKSYDREILTPQLEEGITDVVFKNKEDSVRALQNSYKNINLVFKAFYQNQY